MSSMHRRAVVVSIGDELVLGQSLDTNSRWLSERLLDRGVRPIRHVTVDDEIGAIAEEIERGARDADLVVVTGGLGPTADDLTREGLARAMGESLVEDAGALAEVEGWYAGRGKAMPRTNRVQAMRPEGARCLSNANGTAPGLAGVVGGVEVFCLPGPPREMEPMFARWVEPALRPDRVVLTRLVRTMGLGESRVAELLGGRMERGRNPMVGTTASAGVVTVRMRWEGAASDGSGAGALDEAERGVRGVLGAAVVTPEGGDGERGLVEVVVDLLAARGEKLAVVESCTGGLLGSMVTAVPGSSAVFTGGWVTYTNAMKASAVGVDRGLFPEVVPGAPGAVSGEVAQEMALGGLARARHEIGSERGADHALAITGIAGPDGGSEAKPVGTVWICRASGDGSVDCRRFVFAGGRGAVREWAANTALGMLRLKLAGVDLELLRERERIAG
ncbi:MAG: CinA family nicotinamide mononucleotide deamidase-related protein [Phycisphaerales bacterium JB054]